MGRHIRSSGRAGGHHHTQCRKYKDALHRFASFRVFLEYYIYMETYDKNFTNKYSDKNVSDPLKILSHYLEIGGTMLANHCNSCNSPLFRYHGVVFCPVCSSSEKNSQSCQSVGNSIDHNIRNVKHDSNIKNQKEDLAFKKSSSPVIRNLKFVIETANPSLVTHH